MYIISSETVNIKFEAGFLFGSKTFENIRGYCFIIEIINSMNFYIYYTWIFLKK